MGWPCLAKAEPQEPALQMGLLARSYSQKSFFLVAYLDRVIGLSGQALQLSRIPLGWVVLGSFFGL